VRRDTRDHLAAWAGAAAGTLLGGSLAGTFWGERSPTRVAAIVAGAFAVVAAVIGVHLFAVRRWGSS
jgi:nitrate reductase gamma subunit